jgi:hypothetical protein
MPNNHNFKDYKRKYSRGYMGESQKTIGEKPGKGNQIEKTDTKAVAKRKGNHAKGEKLRDNPQKGNSQGNDKNGKGHDGDYGRKKLIDTLYQ